MTILKIIPRGSNRLDIKLNGKIDAEEMQAALNELESRCQNIENGQILYDVIDFKIPTASAIGVEFSRLPAMLKLMKKFNRAAILTDKRWLKMVSEFEGMLFPGLDIKAFNRDQRAEAEIWLSR